MVNIPSISVQEICALVEGETTGSHSFSIDQLGEPQELQNTGVSFVFAESYISKASETNAQVLVVSEALKSKLQASASVKAVIYCKDAYLGLARLSAFVVERDKLADWQPTCSAQNKSEWNLREGAYVHISAELQDNVQLAPGVVVCENSVIGSGTVILPNVVIGPNVQVGKKCVIFPGAVLYPKTQVGSGVRIHSNVVLGSDGFGYVRAPSGLSKIWHLGRVIIGDDVEIGAGTTIDRGTIKDTRVEKGAKIDNIVQIGHNGHVKPYAILCAQVGMAGNVTIGMGAILAGKAGIADKVEIGDGAVIGPMSGISKNINAGEVIMGQHVAKPRREWWKLIALFDRLPEIYERLKKLEGKK